jgi:hypothetical protein
MLRGRQDEALLRRRRQREDAGTTTECGIIEEG